MIKLKSLVEGTTWEVEPCPLCKGKGQNPFGFNVKGKCLTCGGLGKVPKHVSSDPHPDWEAEKYEKMSQQLPNMFPSRRNNERVEPMDEAFQLDARLKPAVEKFVQVLVSKGIFNSYHRERTGGDMAPTDFEEDLVHKIVGAIAEWTQTMNNRNNWENQPNMIK